MKFICFRRCYFRNHLFGVGDVLEVADPKEVPRHFVPESKFSKEAVAKAEQEDRMTRRKQVEALRKMVVS